MLRSTEELIGYKLVGTDDELGKVKDLLFDDRHWVIRYLVADTGGWLSENKVIIPPIVVGEPRAAERVLPVALSKAQIEGAPSLEKNAPVSRRYERIWHQHFERPVYWEAVGPTGMPFVASAQPLTPADREQARDRAVEDGETTHLRSVDEVTGYDIVARDGAIGHVEEFVYEDQQWILRYMVVDTRNWLPGRKVLISPEWIGGFDWPEETVSVSLTREQIENSPQYNPNYPVNRRYETRLYDYYGRPHYWSDE